jgi:hypothetical protein
MLEYLRRALVSAPDLKARQCLPDIWSDPTHGSAGGRPPPARHAPGKWRDRSAHRRTNFLERQGLGGVTCSDGADASSPHIRAGVPLMGGSAMKIMVAHRARLPRSQLTNVRVTDVIISPSHGEPSGSIRYFLIWFSSNLNDPLRISIGALNGSFGLCNCRWNR